MSDNRGISVKALVLGILTDVGGSVEWGTSYSPPMKGVQR